MQWSDLEGKKTYIMAALAAICTALYALGIISQSTWQTLMGILVPAGMATLKAGQVAESAKVVAKVQGAEDLEKSKVCYPR